MPIEKKLKFADFVIDNSGTLANTQLQVNGIINNANSPRICGIENCRTKV